MPDLWHHYDHMLHVMSRFMVWSYWSTLLKHK